LPACPHSGHRDGWTCGRTEQNSEDLTTAAARLGLTAETIRKRLQRGKLKGFKAADGTWRVSLDSKQDSPGRPFRNLCAKSADLESVGFQWVAPSLFV
jgi:hypothetical protein